MISSAGHWLRRQAAAIAYVVGTLAFVLRTEPGRLGVDTKQYLFLDPGGYIADARVLWTPDTAFGTVTHQNIGFLWPMGPFFWIGEQLGLADWVTQRLWLACLFVAAGLGVRSAARHLGLGPAGAWAAALIYAWNPYTLGYVHRTSVLLLAWAGLGWLLVFAIRSVRIGGWRDPAAFALVAFTVSGANAPAFLFVGIGPALWVALSASDPAVGWRRAGRAALCIGLLTLGVSVWWIVALLVQGSYGLNVLEYSESLDAIALTTSAVEIFRGLGYWVFYGRDRLAPWVAPAPSYQESGRLLALTFGLPVLGATSLALLRWRQLAFAGLLVLVGLTIGTGVHPWDAPSAVGAAFKAVATSSTAGLALRSSSRAVPLLVLALALAVGAVISALGRKVRWHRLVATALVGAVALVAFPPLWEGTLVDRELSRPEELPSTWTDAATWLDSQQTDTRVLEVPGIDLTFYRWGATWEPVLRGLIDRPQAARELIPYGGAGSVDLLMALDRRMQEGTFEADSLGAVARLLGVGDVVLRSDLQYERYRTPRPRWLWGLLADGSSGLGAPVPFGPGSPNVAGPKLPLLDELELRIADDAEHPPEVAAFPVDGARPLVRAEPLDGLVLVSGSGDGLVDAAAAGVLTEPGAVLYSASFQEDPDTLDEILSSGADVLLTDSNRRRGQRWRTLRDNAGFTEVAGEQPLVEDLSDARLDLFPGTDDASRSVAVAEGALARATAYGNTVSFTPDVRPALAIDGDPTTAWRVGTFGDPVGERLVIDLEQPRDLDEIRVIQDRPAGSRAVTQVAVRVDGQLVDQFDLDHRSEAAPGQPLHLAREGVSQIELEVLATTDDGSDASIGIAEVEIPGLEASEWIRLPNDLVGGTRDLLDQRLVISLARLRSDPGEVVRDDEERALRRIVDVPTDRTFTAAGTIRISARADDATLTDVLDVTGPSLTASDTLGGDLRSRPWSANDGDTRTRWRPGFGEQRGRWIELDAGRPITFDRLDLAVVADGRHSVPTEVTISAGGASRTVALPALTDGNEPGTVATVPLTFDPLTGQRIRLTIDDVRERRTRDWYSLSDITTPIGIAELGLPGLTRSELPDQIDTGCRDDLLTVAGRPVSIRATGPLGEALDLEGLAAEPCDRGEVLHLASGSNRIETAPGRATGLDVDALVLASDPGGGPAADARAPLGVVSSRPVSMSIQAEGRTKHELHVTPGSDGAIIVLGENLNAGWSATADGEDLGPPTLVDGYANGWFLPPSDQTVAVQLTWRPQRSVDLGLMVSLGVVLVCVAIVVLRRRATTTPPQRAIDAPLLRWPWLPARHLALGGAVRAGVATGVVAALVARPLTGLLVAGGVILASRLRRGRLLLIGGGVGCLAAGLGWVVITQLQDRWPADFSWPTHFDRMHDVVWCGALLLLAATLLEVLRGDPDPDPPDASVRPHDA